MGTRNPRTGEAVDPDIEIDAARALTDRFWSKVDKNGPVPAHRPELGPCWLWKAAIDGWGYGGFYVGTDRKNAAVRKAHRLTWIAINGAIPSGLELDHICRVRHCCNPRHVEPVTRSMNNSRGRVGQTAKDRHERVTHCPNGHAYDEANTYRRATKYGGTSRKCRTCAAIRQQPRNAATSAARAARREARA